MAFESNSGTNKLANVLTGRMKKENAAPLVLDFGEIQEDGSLVTNTFPQPVPKGDYSILRQLTLGGIGEMFTSTGNDGLDHVHTVVIPEKMRRVAPGDRVLVAWVQSEAVVVDLVMGS